MNDLKSQIANRKCAGLLLFLILAAFPAFSQDKTITVIVFRHADKEVAVEGDDSEPDISVEGQRRAIRLAKILKKYKVSRIFSTNYARTIQTVTPFSRMTNLPVEFYEPGAPNELVESLLKSNKDRRIAVAAHNSTAFALVNLLLKQQRYEMPVEDDYGSIWILKMKKGRVTERRLVY